MNAKKTGKLISTLRTSKNYTQKKLAELINISDKAVSKWERGDGCPDVSIMPVLAEALGVDVECIMNGELPPSSKVLVTDIPGRKIKTYDFRRPDKWGREDLYAIGNLFTNVGQKIEAAFAGFRNENCRINLCCVDQLTNFEFQRSIPASCFITDYEYNNAGYVIEIDPEVGKTLLKQNIKDFPDISSFDQNVIRQFFTDEINRLLNEEFFTQFGNLPEEKQNKYKKTFSEIKNNPSTMNQQRDQMCCLISYELKVGQTTGFINIQISDCFLDNLRSLGFFGFNWKEPEIQYLSEINSKKQENNLFAEFGRFNADNVELKVGKILVFDRKYYEAINIVYENKIIHTAEVIVIDEKLGIRIIDSDSIPDISYNENDNYISVVLGSCYLVPEEIQNLRENIILELNTFAGYPSAIIQNGKLIGYGEIVVVGDRCGVKITEIKE